MDKKEISKDILNNMKELVIYYQPESGMRILWANKAAADSVELKPHQLEGRYCYEAWHKRDMPCEGCPVKKSLKTKKAEKAEIKSPDGRFWLVRSRPILDENKQITGIIEYTSEITEYSKVNKALEESEVKYRLISESTSDLISITEFDFKARVIYVNFAYYKLLGYRTDELIGTSGIDLVHPDDKKKLLPLLKKYLKEKAHGILGGKKGQISEKLEYRIKDAKGNWRMLEATLNLVDDKLLFVAKDITDRKKMSEKIARSAEEWSETFDFMSDCVSLHGTDYTILNANRSLCELLGKKKEEIVGKKCFEVFHNKKQPIKNCPMAFSLKQKKEKRMDFFEPTINKWLAGYTSPIIDKSGKITKVVHVVRDVSEKRRVTKALETEALRHRILIEQSRDGIVVLNQEGKVYEANRRFAEMLEYSPEETSRLHVWDWEYKLPREQLLDMLGKVDETGDHFETQHRRKDGTVYDVEISTNGALFAGKKLIFCVCRDITERKRIEEETEKRTKELERFNKLMVGREIKMMEMKNKIKELEEKINK